MFLDVQVQQAARNRVLIVLLHRLGRLKVRQPVEPCAAQDTPHRAVPDAQILTKFDGMAVGSCVARPMPVAGFEKWMETPPQPKGDSQ